MQLLEKCNLYMELPSVLHEHRSCTKNRSLEYAAYQSVRELYNIHSQRVEGPNYFKDPSFTLVSKLVQPGSNVNVDYIVVCYGTYPLMDQVSPPLFIKKMLNMEKSIAFSLTNQGGLAPVTAIHYGNMVGKSLFTVCMEQHIDIEQPNSQRYAKADALAMVRLHPTMGPFQILYYGITLNENSLFSMRYVHSAIEAIVTRAGVTLDMLVVIPRSFSDLYTAAIKRQYPYVYVHEDRKDYSTADPLYSLSEYMKLPEIRKPYILLVFLDDFGTGCVLIRDNEYSPIFPRATQIT